MSLSMENRKLENFTDELLAHCAYLGKQCRAQEAKTLSKEKARLQLEEELKSKDQMIQDLISQREALLAQHEHELSRKVQENRKLHTMVLERGQGSDPHDDGHFTAKFTALENNIERVVMKHFSGNLDKTGWKAYDSVKRRDDRDFFLQAHIATAIAQALFSPDARLFGLDERTEQRQAAFEKLMQDSHVPTEQILDWRIQTFKVAELTISKDRDNRTVKISRELSEQLKNVHKRVPPNDDWLSAREALEALLKSAFDLALSIRSCKAEYEWDQTASPASLNETHIKYIDRYNLGSQEPTGRPVKVLFGPVYKRVNAKAVLLRSGTVLCG